MPEAVFICGRQHSGNTLMATVFERLPGYFCIADEGDFFEHRPRIDAMQDPARRAAWICEHLKTHRPDLEEAARARLLDWIGESGQTDALSLYREAMRYLTEYTGNRCWAQKATSYIFFADRILREMPEARIVYMMRNPFDVAASKKRRDPRQEYLLGWTVSWNRGAALARRLMREYPDRTHLVRFESLLEEPERVLRELCLFLGVPYTPDGLQVDHVNPAEDPYRKKEGAKGFDRSKAYYYPKSLRPSEIAAVDMLASAKLLAQYYGDLPHRRRRLGILPLLGGVWRIASGSVRSLFERIRWARRQGVSPVRYLAVRLLGIHPRERRAGTSGS